VGVEGGAVRSGHSRREGGNGHRHDARGHRQKGTIAIGADADIAIWDPNKTVAIDDAMVKDRSGYSPWVGRTITGWPSTVIRRVTIIVENGEILAPASSGRFLARSAGVAAKPTGRDAPEFDPRLNFQAKLR
jgi:dihydropyrimidinase